MPGRRSKAHADHARPIVAAHVITSLILGRSKPKHSSPLPPRSGGEGSGVGGLSACSLPHAGTKPAEFIAAHRHRTCRSTPHPRPLPATRYVRGGRGEARSFPSRSPPYKESPTRRYDLRRLSFTRSKPKHSSPLPPRSGGEGSGVGGLSACSLPHAGTKPAEFIAAHRHRTCRSTPHPRPLPATRCARGGRGEAARSFPSRSAGYAA
jgi:hypothetical protein